MTLNEKDPTTPIFEEVRARHLITFDETQPTPESHEEPDNMPNPENIPEDSDLLNDEGTTSGATAVGEAQPERAMSYEEFQAAQNQEISDDEFREAVRTPAPVPVGDVLNQPYTQEPDVDPAATQVIFQVPAQQYVVDENGVRQMGVDGFLIEGPDMQQALAKVAAARDAGEEADIDIELETNVNLGESIEDGEKYDVQEDAPEEVLFIGEAMPLMVNRKEDKVLVGTANVVRYANRTELICSLEGHEDSEEMAKFLASDLVGGFSIGGIMSPEAQSKIAKHLQQ